MHYIMMDMEWNQAPCAERTIRKPVPLTGEVIEIGAVKLSEEFEIVDDFKLYIKPKYYTKIKREITKLTGITAQDLSHGVSFPLAFYQFQLWCGEDALLFTWGNDDIRMLKNNLLFHGLQEESYPKAYDLQLMFAFLEMGNTAQQSLHAAVEHFGIPEDLPAHDALNDAYYTARIAQKLDLPKGLSQYTDHLSVWMSHTPISSETLGSFPDKLAALRQREVRGVCCPRCGKALLTPKWISQGNNKKIVKAACPEDGEFLYRLTFQNMGRRGFQVLKESFVLDEELSVFYEGKLKQWRARKEKRAEKAEA